MQFLPEAKFLSTHRVCGPPVKRCGLGAMPRGGANFETERVRSVEEAVLKTVAPSKGVRGSSPWRSANFVRTVQ